MSALRAEELTARYAGQSPSAAALVNLDLELEAGERLLLLGPNGAGKSTFIRVFAGLMREAHGKAEILGRKASSARQDVGVVGHATFLYEELSAAENLGFYAELYGVRNPHACAAALLDELGLAQLAKERVGRLSRGQQQRVTIARALLHDPAVLLLDEPDTGLDIAAFARLEELVTAPGRTVVLTSHDLARGVRAATRVAVLSRGRLAHQQPAVSPADVPALAALLERLALE